jgi:1-acyl-sn-glycerol-3-phosphate acyltransferase
MLSLFDVLIRSILTVWGYFFFVFGSILWGVLVIPITIVASRFCPRARDWFNEFTRATISVYVRLLPFLKLRVDRSENPHQGARILVANHQSWLDPIIMFALERRLSGPARGYLFRTPVLGSVLKFARFYLSDTGEPAPLGRMRQGVQEALENRGTLLFYPEGTRTRTGAIGDFHMGAFRMAVEYKLPIQPVVIDGLDRVFPSEGLLVKTRGRHLVQVRYLDPIEPPYGEGPQRRVVHELGRRVRLAMVDELDRLRRERKSTGRGQPEHV